MKKQRQKAVDYIGKTIGRLTILSIDKEDGQHGFFISDCSCGVKNHRTRCDHIMQRKVLSCGCLQREIASIVDDLTGQEFGRLTVIKQAPDRFTAAGEREAMWECVCNKDGNRVIVLARCLTYGNTLSCGCLGKEARRQAATKHGKSDNPLYTRLRRIINRCKGMRSYENISVYKPWVQDRGSFVTYMEQLDPDVYLKLEQGQHVDRFPNKTGNYEPGNVRMATPEVNSNNLSCNVIFMAFRKKNTLANHCRNYPKVPYKTVQHRLKRGWSPEKALILIPTPGNPHDFDWKKLPFTEEEEINYMEVYSAYTPKGK